MSPESIRGGIPPALSAQTAGAAPRAVSYTHLDVYKRQLVGRVCHGVLETWEWDAAEVAGAVARAAQRLKAECPGVDWRAIEDAVSYTHLDVYKRQELLLPGPVGWTVWTGLRRRNAGPWWIIKTKNGKRAC